MQSNARSTVVFIAVFLAVFLALFWMTGERALAVNGDAADLADASRWVEARKNAEARARIASETEPMALVGMPRFYKPGDRWVVSVRTVSHAMVRMRGGRPGADRALDPIRFEFNVLEAGDGQAGAKVARIEVRPLGADGKPQSGARIARVMVTVDDRLTIVSKRYFHRDLAAPLTAELDGPGNVPMGFDAFPLDLPDFRHSKTSVGIDSVQLESRDLFARPVRFTWKKGDLWPADAEMRGSRGALERQEKAS